MMNRSWAITGLLVGGFSGPLPAQVEAPAGFLLIRRDHEVQPVRVVQIDDRALVHGDAARGWVNVPLRECVALVDPDAGPTGQSAGLLRLTDGQRFPGAALSGARPTDDVLVWIQSSWLGRMEVPLERIESVVFSEDAPVPTPGDADVLLLANGDRMEGFVTALGDPISIEMLNDGKRQTIEIPLDRASAVRMVTPRQRPAGRRLWMADGTVVDVERITLGDDGVVRVGGLPFVVEPAPKRVELSAVAAVLFDPDRLIPLGALEPTRVRGPATRYVVPRPRVLDDLAPLGLSRVELRGPVAVRYALPAEGTYLSAEARLPVLSRSWGDCELVIRDGQGEVFSARLNAASPTASVGVTLRDEQLLIEITEGSNGPIQDHVILHRAMLLLDVGKGLRD
ncbi:MAG: hypothetical protein ACYS0G_07955 [Planctomycetota bacterium]|jgi:hypothetical protein